ncbi:hypothetical protein DVR12_14540 [Chitinophaga silvatica]|uniref:DUF3592 domain-containing protein n=1 Tax=Chitinophaga silvatica TaxID=2282649 RepID=A0A3E1Y8Y1_9BACT|nr:DUF3592 domain-containing protein [Chitinophaga silvatica]RFS21867.1 hypothetical protein DVR12_14540 [Chitinophaga silvatica]
MTIYLIFIIVGILLLVGGINSLNNLREFVKSNEQAVGTVIELVETNDDDGILYYPVFEIRTRRNEIITYKHSTASSNPKWTLGKTTTFIFKSDNPDSIRILNFWTVFWWPLCLMAVAADLLIIGIFYFLLQGYFNA